MYYQTESKRYYKLNNRKSVRVTKEEGENNIYQLNQLNTIDLKKLLNISSRVSKDEMLRLLIQKIKKDNKFEDEVKRYIIEKIGVVENRKESVRGNQKPGKGDIVRIIIKPYDEGVTKIGVVKDVLTRKEVHTRGHKVRLHNGVIGRLVKIIRKKRV